MKPWLAIGLGVDGAGCLAMLSRLAAIVAERRSARAHTAEIKRRAALRANALRWKASGRTRLPKTEDVVGPLEAEYKARLRSMVQSWARQTMRALEPLLREYAGARADALDTPESVIGRLRRELASQDAESAARRVFSRLEARGRAAANAQVAPLTGDIPLWRGLTSSNKNLIDEAVSRNVKLIESIPEQMLGQVEAVLHSGFERGAHVDAIRKELVERFGVAESRAELIARDQLGKMQGQLAEARARELGMDTYIWRVSGGAGGDGRVRPMHLELEGTKQRYDDPPVTNEDGDTNNPGEDVSCRCTAEPDAGALLDALLG